MRLSFIFEAVEAQSDGQKIRQLFDTIKEFFFTNSRTFAGETENINKMYYCMNNIYLTLDRWEYSEGAWKSSLIYLNSIDKQDFKNAQQKFEQHRSDYIKRIAGFLKEIKQIKFSHQIESKFKFGVYRTVYNCVINMIETTPSFENKAEEYSQQLQKIVGKA